MKNWQVFVDKIGANRVKENERAKLYVEVERIDDLVEIVKQARINKIPLFIVGTGSWPQIPNEQINGLLIKNNCRRFDLYAMSGKMKEGQVGIDCKLVYAESGTIINQLVRFSIEEGLSGLEYFLGMPGSVGGAIFTNARYAPQNIYVNDVVEKIRILNKEGEIVEVARDYIIGSARNDFREAEDMILSAVFRLMPFEKKVLWERGHEAAASRDNYLNK